MAYRPFLLDVNTLIALTWPNHVHHARAHRWFSANSAAGWATCPMTQCAFVRTSSNAGIIAEAVDAVDAKAILRELTTHPHHES